MTAVETPPRDRRDRARRRPASTDREQTAARLLASSQRMSFDPTVDVDWASAPVDGLWFMPPERTSLYGTPMWDSMDERQRSELTRHTIASISSSGIFFEMVLMRMLLRHLGREEVTSQHVAYGLTEVADECRHSTMFGRLVTWLGTPSYGPSRKVRGLGEVMTTPLVNDALAFAGAYYVEAILDALQREGAADERCQPVTRRVAHIHVVEEARHMRYADEELARNLSRMGRIDRERTRLILPIVASVCNDILVHPRVYAAAGLPITEAKAVAAANPVWRDTLRWAARRPLAIFSELGLLHGPGMAVWRRAGLL